VSVPSFNSLILMNTKYRLYAHAGQITAVCIGNEFINANGIEVASGESEDLGATLAELAPGGVGSPWPVPGKETAVAAKPAKPAKTAKAEAPKAEAA
jgi:hypothetical protein